MRQLTQTEIENAPDWADEYYIDIKDVWYVNKKYGMAKMNGRVRNIKSHSSIILDAKPIPRKEFDIGEYEFSDGDVLIDDIMSDEIVFESPGVGYSLLKEDVIALAKHFKLTVDGLR